MSLQQSYAIDRSVVDPFNAAQLGFEILANEERLVNAGPDAYDIFYQITPSVAAYLPSLNDVTDQVIHAEGSPDYIGCALFTEEYDDIPPHQDDARILVFKSLGLIGTGRFFAHSNGLLDSHQAHDDIGVGDLLTVVGPFGSPELRLWHRVAPITLPRVALLFGWYR